MSKNLLVAIAAVLVLGSCGPRETPPTTDTTATTATVVPTGTAPEPPKSLDHFKFWKVTPYEYRETVWLFGQADREAWEAQLGNVEYLGNPTEKIRHQPDETTPARSRLHYTVYALQTKVPCAG